jgi:hypothetical protein
MSNRDDGSTPGVSLYQVQANPPDWAKKGVADPFFAMSGDASAAIHGAVYGPNGSVVAYAQDYSPYPPVFNGGVDVLRFTVDNDGGQRPLGVASIANTPGFRYVLVTAQAGGKKPVTARAVVRIGNDVGRSVAIQSWRLCQDLWCSPSKAPN